jgi:UDP-N-acetylmuramate--alanine ligase
LGRGRALDDVERAASAPVWRLGRDFEVETVSVEASGRVLRFHDPECAQAVTGRIRLHGGNIADNAALAFAALRAIGTPAEHAAPALEALDALERRLQVVGEGRGVRVFDDLGKHPEAVAANLRALRELDPRRIHVVYEPSLHADVLRWGRRWADVFGQADSCVVLPMNYRAALPVARRAPSDWIRRAGSSADLAESQAEAIALINDRSEAGDMVVVSGMNDDLATFARTLVERLER